MISDFLWQQLKKKEKFMRVQKTNLMITRMLPRIYLLFKIQKNGDCPNPINNNEEIYLMNRILENWEKEEKKGHHKKWTKKTP